MVGYFIDMSILMVVFFVLAFTAGRVFVPGLRSRPTLRKNASGSNQNISQETLDLENELKSVKNELSQFKKDYELLQAESLALKSTNKQLISASKNNTQVVGYADGENCCFCSCKVDSLTESLNLIKVNE